jgi:hypothetical protein
MMRMPSAEAFVLPFGVRSFQKHSIGWRHLGRAADRPDLVAETVTLRRVDVH